MKKFYAHACVYPGRVEFANKRPEYRPYRLTPASWNRLLFLIHRYYGKVVAGSTHAAKEPASPAKPHYFYVYLDDLP